jgi:hypothetical protein
LVEILILCTLCDRCPYIVCQMLTHRVQLVYLLEYLSTYSAAYFFRFFQYFLLLFFIQWKSIVFIYKSLSKRSFQHVIILTRTMHRIFYYHISIIKVFRIRWLMIEAYKFIRTFLLTWIRWTLGIGAVPNLYILYIYIYIYIYIIFYIPE